MCKSDVSPAGEAAKCLSRRLVLVTLRYDFGLGGRRRRSTLHEQ